MKRNPDDTVCQPAAAAEMPQTYVNTHTHTHNLTILSEQKRRKRSLSPDNEEKKIHM